MGDKKILLGKKHSQKSKFSDDFCSASPGFKKNLTTQPVASPKNKPMQPVIVNPALMLDSAR
jgi:hypothetical protein